MFDLSKFKKIGSDEKSSTLKHMEDGHEIKVFHDKVDDKVLRQLSGLKVHKFASGGSIKDDFSDISSNQPIKEYQSGPPVNPVVDSVNSFIDDHPSVKSFVGKDEDLASRDVANVEEAEDISLDEPSVTQPEATELIPGSQPIANSGPSSKLLQQSLDDQISGASQVAKAQVNLAGETQKLEQENAKQQIQAKEDYLKAQAPLLAKEAELNNWLEAHPENAKRYVDNMSTGGKIRTALGLILGGIGSGMTHGPNVAFQYLQKQIDNDLEEQKSNIGTKKGLLAHNMQQMGNIRDAYTMTKIQNNEIMSSYLKSAAAKASGEAALGSLNQMIGKFKQQNLILNSKISTSGVNKNDAQYIKEVNSRKSTIDSNVDKAINMIQKKGTYEAVGPHNDNLDRIMDQVAVDMAKLQDPNSVARPGEVELVKQGLVKSGIFQQNKTAISKLKAFKKEVEERARVAHESRGLTPQAETKTMNGIKYQKVQGGWKKVQ